MSVKRKVNGKFPEFCYRAFKCKKYAEDFINKGCFRLGRIEYYKNIECDFRQDKTEGCGYTKELGKVEVYGYSKNTNDPPIHKKVQSYQTNYISVHNPKFIMCMCFSDVDWDHIKKLGNYVVKIDQPKKIAEEIRNHLFKMGLNFMIEGHKVVYDKGKEIDETLTEDERYERAYMQKPEKFSSDCEFRIVAMNLDDNKEEFLEINLNKSLNYVSLVGDN